VTTSTAQKKRPNQRARIRLAAVELLQQHPEGLTYTELVQAMRLNRTGFRGGLLA
jgi:hypothetical protein